MSTYDDVELALRRADSHMGAAEAHGCLCGMLCAPRAATLVGWLTVVCEDSDADPARAGRDHPVLREVYDQAVDDLSDPQVFLAPLIPSEREPLGDRLIAVSEWCEGYLYGLALAGVQGDSPLSGSAAEVLQDLAEIARSEFEFEDDETHEAALFEVIEYLRVGIQLVKEALAEADTPPKLH
jgi:yecA family protein